MDKHPNGHIISTQDQGWNHAYASGITILSNGLILVDTQHAILINGFGMQRRKPGRSQKITVLMLIFMEKSKLRQRILVQQDYTCDGEICLHINQGAKNVVRVVQESSFLCTSKTNTVLCIIRQI